MAIMQNMIYNSVFEVDSVLENKMIFKSCWLHFEQNDLKYMNWSGAARARLRFFLHLPTTTFTIFQTLQKFRTKNKTHQDHFHFQFLDIAICWGNCR